MGFHHYKTILKARNVNGNFLTFGVSVFKQPTCGDETDEQPLHVCTNDLSLADYRNFLHFCSFGGA